jgi:hypothetical protein
VFVATMTMLADELERQSAARYDSPTSSEEIARGAN